VDGVVSDELTGLGLTATAGVGGVSFSGDLEAGYRAVLWLRATSRVLLEVVRLPGGDNADALYEAARRVDWRDILTPTATLAVFCTHDGAVKIHTQYFALRLKDAIVDQLRDARGDRPNVDVENPDIRLHLHVGAEASTVAVDLGGEALHKRGFRRGRAEAPLKETLASAMLLLLEWPKLAESGAPFVDPMCGSGTLCIEAALIDGRRAPGLDKRGPIGWVGHDARLWERLRAEAKAAERRQHAPIFGFDRDGDAILAARANAQRAGIEATFAVADFAEIAAPAETPGLVAVNPPYGERLSAEEDLRPLYAQLGDGLKHKFGGWRAGILTTVELSRAVELRPEKRHTLYNGALECRLLDLPISAAAPDSVGPSWRRASPASEAFANRLRKNFKHRQKWAKREGVTCWRVYDADLPEYAVAVDLYEGAAQVAEYAPPREIEPAVAARRLRDAVLRVEEVLGVEVFVKTRRRQHRDDQYQRLDTRGEERVVHEGAAKLRVNLTDYLDTGLYLDERLVRAELGKLAAGKDFLNLFCYTATATVQAALAGARSTLSVDLSNTYLAWAERNLVENGLAPPKHRLERAEIRAWLAQRSRQFDVIFLAPPTYSRGKAMPEDLDVQRDHVDLIESAARLLQPGGTLIFSTHARKFKLDGAALAALHPEDLSRRTRPPDFASDPRVHQCWKFSR
jgi:23S rRNA (guanine2445-N2)-methyltransferase / 23S rRNA (guanine2069-N7)-methyltransferase